MSARPPAPVHGVFTRFAKSAFTILLLAFAAFCASPASAEDLHYFKNYFVTGDYTVAGVGLYGKGVAGTATGTINMNTVPAGADIVAAFLYWQTTETGTTANSSNGMFDGKPIVGAVLGNALAPACWTPNGATSTTAYARVYRADVLRYLPINDALNIRLANGLHTVALPDSGNTPVTTTPHTNGATLVIVYRMLSVGAVPYKAVVMYDGAYTMTRSTPAFSQIMGGFYQASGYGAKMTQIVGSGQLTNSVYLTVNGQTEAGNNVFDGLAGPRWDNPTFEIDLPPGASSLQTQALSTSTPSCVSWSAVIMSTNVVDSDGDGLLDTWESRGLHLNIGTPGSPLIPKTATTLEVPAVPAVTATFGGCKDYPAEPCENFPAMGAINGIKDIFVQIDWMQGAAANDSPAHIHLPKLAALQMIASVFASHGNIAVHFDVGNHYQQKPMLPYIVPASLAKGGNVIQEGPLECVTSSTVTCEFPNKPVLGWKEGFDAIANGYTALNIPSYFLQDRKDSFHYIIFGHALSGPFVDPPDHQPPDPYSVSGVADTPGGDVLVTLGEWRADDPANCVQNSFTDANANICIDQTGTALQQAGTVMHELGHNLGLHHAGTIDDPNCMPNYPSVMNYLYQTRGLTDAAGNEHVDFSFGLLNGLNENSLSETKPFGIMLYRTRYYASPNAAERAAGSFAKAHCDGTSKSYDEVRLESPGIQIPDWNHDGKVQSTPVAVDINFNGTVGSVTADSIQPTDANASDPRKLWFIDHNDWFTLNLQQIGARLNVNGLSADVGQKDLGQKDLGQKDLGQKDLGQKDLGQKDLGQKDLGQSNLGDVDYDTAISTLDPTGTTTPLVATVGAKVPANIASTGYNQITLTWGAPSLGQIRKYTVFRTNNSANPPTLFQIPVTGSPVPPTTYVDQVTDDPQAPHSPATCPLSIVCYNTNYSYFITATDINNTTSTPSNTVTATVNHLFVTSYSSNNVIYGNALPNFSSTAATISGLPSGGITSSAFACTNTTGSKPPRNAGPYVITCTGPLAVGTGTVTGVTYIPGTLTINKRPLTIVAQTDTKVYDGTTGAATIPVPLPPVTNVSGLAYTDSLISAETYDTVNVGTGKTLFVTAIVISDGNYGGNYIVATTPNSTGVITAAALTLTAQASTKVYDANTSSPVKPVVTGLVGAIPHGDTVSPLAETYDNANVGTGKTLTVTTYTVNDGNHGQNYVVSTVPVSTGEIDTLYTANSNVTDFLKVNDNPLVFAQFDAVDGLDSGLELPYTPATTDLTAGYRVVGNGDNPRILVEFPSAVSKIRVFPNIDHPAGEFDGYQYTIWGSNDNSSWTLLYDATAVTTQSDGSFTLGAYTGQAPNVVNNVVPLGTPDAANVVGYEADFDFGATSYKYFAFGASTIAKHDSNSDEELSGVAALP